jgi:hypothetical protein
MDSQYRFEPIPSGGTVVHCFECPLELMIFAATLMTGVVTLENVRVQPNTDWFSTEIIAGKEMRFNRLRNLVFDATVAAAEFVALVPHWSRVGVYAVSGSRELGFRASDLDFPGRYRALANFGWQIELAIPGPSGPHWGSIAFADDTHLPQFQAAAAAAYPGST